MQIVIAWTQEVWAWNGEPFATDLGHRPKTVLKLEPLAAMWLREGSASDLENAKRYVSNMENGRVFEFDDHADPLVEARARIMKELGGQS